MDQVQEVDESASSQNSKPSSMASQKDAISTLSALVTTELNDIKQDAAVVLNNAATAKEHLNKNHDLAIRVRATAERLAHGLLERDTEVRLMLLAALAGEHLLLLGPPGTAKSELARRLSEVCDGRFFERLLTRFSVPEELFGHLSMSGLENDKYVRQTDGYLPTADVAFVDEIFKANSAILLLRRSCSTPTCPTP